MPENKGNHAEVNGLGMYYEIHGAAPWACSVCAAPRIGLPQDGRCIPSGTSRFTT